MRSSGRKVDQGRGFHVDVAFGAVLECISVDDDVVRTMAIRKKSPARPCRGCFRSVYTVAIETEAVGAPIFFLGSFFCLLGVKKGRKSMHVVNK